MRAVWAEQGGVLPFRALAAEQGHSMENRVAALWVLRDNSAQAFRSLACATTHAPLWGAGCLQPKAALHCSCMPGQPPLPCISLAGSIAETIGTTTIRHNNSSIPRCPATSLQVRLL